MGCKYCCGVIPAVRLMYRALYCSKQCQKRMEYNKKRHLVSAFAGQGPWFGRIDDEPEAFARRAWATIQRMSGDGFGCYRIERATGIGYQTVHRWLRNGGPPWLEKAAKRRESELRGQAA